MRLVIGLDFDGVLHVRASGLPWGSPPDGPPVPGALSWLRGALSAGHRVAIQSCRSADAVGRAGMQAWLSANGCGDLIDLLEWPATKVECDVYIDDRGYRFAGEWPTLARLQALRSWMDDQEA
jgi:hypothetical protein